MIDAAATMARTGTARTGELSRRGPWQGVLRATSASGWQALEAHVDAALDIAPEERRALVAARCQGDEALHAAVLEWLDACEEEGGPLELPVHGEPAPLPVDTRVGPWRLLGEIGRGGMGAVYLAERADRDVPMRAALKFMHRAITFDAVGVRRFRDERRILATLEHPAIARLLDGGVTDGVPWFAMEHVPGARIDDWCDARALTTSARIALFCRVCEGVQHAHARLVVHRDLKPANILVADSGEPKLLDFGIAKLLADAESSESNESAFTRTGWQPMTAAYAAPEQRRGDPPSTSTDVYSLGVLLHLLLSGWLPRSDARMSALAGSGGDPIDPDALARNAEARGTTPAKLQRRLRGDLDTIVALAMHPEPARRYASADALAADLRRHLEGRPVLARPDTVSYRLRRLLRRHPAGSAIGIAGCLLVSGFTVVTSVQSRQLRTQAVVLREQAVRLTAERDKATQVTSFLANVLASADPYESGRSPTLREVLDRAAARADTALRDHPDVRAHLLSAIAPAYFGLGDWARAGDLAEEAVTIRRARLGNAHPELAAALVYLAGVRLNQDRAAEGEAHAREALAINSASATAPVRDRASALSTLGSALQRQGKYAQSEGILRSLLETERARVPADSLRIAQVARNLAHTLRDQQRFAAALPLYQEAYDLHRRLYGDEHPESANSAVNLGSAHFSAGNAVAAESLLRRGVGVKRRLLGIQHPDVASDQLTLARVLAQRGARGEAAQLAAESEAVLCGEGASCGRKR